MADELNRPEIKNFIEAFVEEDIGPGGQCEEMCIRDRAVPPVCAACFARRKHGKASSSGASNVRGPQRSRSSGSAGFSARFG